MGGHPLPPCQGVLRSPLLEPRGPVRWPLCAVSPSLPSPLRLRGGNHPVLTSGELQHSLLVSLNPLGAFKNRLFIRLSSISQACHLHPSKSLVLYQLMREGFQNCTLGTGNSEFFKLHRLRLVKQTVIMEVAFYLIKSSWDSALQIKEGGTGANKNSSEACC